MAGRKNAHQPLCKNRKAKINKLRNFMPHTIRFDTRWLKPINYMSLSGMKQLCKRCHREYNEFWTGSICPACLNNSMEEENEDIGIDEDDDE